MAIGDFSYGWSQDDPLNYGGGGAIGSQVGSQTGEGGAGWGSGFSMLSSESPELNPGVEGPGAGTGGYPAQQDGSPGGPNPNPNPNPAVPPLTAADYYKQLEEYAKQKGVGMEPGYLNDLNRGYQGQGGQGGRTTADIYNLLRSQIDQRAGNTPGGTGNSSPGSPSSPSIDAMRSTASQLFSSPDANTAAMLRDQLSRQISQTLQGQGHEVKFAEDGTMLVDGRPYQVAGGDIAGMNSWMPSGQSTYHPGEIGFGDIPNFSFDSLMQMMDAPQVDAFVQDILAHPESLDERMTSSMKATSKDELAAQQQMQEEDMHTLAQQGGFEESPWLAGQVLSSRQGRDRAVVESNRAIDMGAAQTNMADKRAAAQLGLGYEQGKQSRVMSAVSASLDRSAAIGGRTALRESVNQAAAQLNMSAQELLANHVQFQLRNLQTKYGIDVGADISYADLSQADRHFGEDLALRLQQLQESIAARYQQDHQFSASLNLDAERLKLEQDKWDWAQKHPSEVNN